MFYEKKFEGPNTRKGPDGREVLRPCLACDEYRSGPAILSIQLLLFSSCSRLRANFLY